MRQSMDELIGTKNKIEPWRIILIVFIIVAIVGAAICGWYYLDRKLNTDKVEKINDDIEDEVIGPRGTVDPDKVEKIKKEKKYDGFLGYIIQEGVLSYPVVQGTDNSYYLSHAIDGSYNFNGAIFMDYKCREQFDGKNCILYGHNMWNTVMFSSLMGYIGESGGYNAQAYYEAHPDFTVVYGGKMYKYVVAAAFSGSTYNDKAYTYDFSGKGAFKDWYKAQLARSVIRCTYSEPDSNSQFLTLSTCTRSDSSRKVIVILLKESESNY